MIRALNADLPYGEFLRLQIAGDLIAPGDYDATAATGFLVAGPYPGQVTAKTVEPIRYDQLDDMLATIGSSVLGMTIGCARCHDHKYDPIGHRDYYAMIACLGKAVQRDADLDPDPESTRRKHAAWQAERAAIAATVDRFRRDELPARVARWLATDAGAGQAAAWMALDATAFQAAKATLTKQPDDVIAASGRLEGDDTYTLTFRTHQRGLAAVRLEALATGTAPGSGPGTGKEGSFRLSTVKVTAAPLAPAADRVPVTPALVPVATTFQDPGFELAKAVDGDPGTGWATSGQPGLGQAAVLAFDKPVGFEGGTLLTVELKFEANQPGLARLRVAATTEPSRARLGDAAAPQAAREIAAVLEATRTAGHDEATSPELLEWLAARLVGNRWSLKSIHRLIVTSAAYRQAGAVSDAALAKDPDNTLLWHRKPVRLEGEAIRDALLAAGGLLDDTLGGRAGLDVTAPRRSIYLTVKRSEPVGFLQVFDQPEPVQPVGARGVATVPTQALAMMNSPFVRAAAEGLAKRARTALAIPAGDTAGGAAVEYCFIAALSRPPSEPERGKFLALLAAREQAASGNPAGRQAALADVCQLIFCLNEFVYVD